MREISVPQPVSFEDQIREALDREKQLVEYYHDVIGGIGPDAEFIMQQICDEHKKHIGLLERLVVEFEELRELCLPMVD